MTKHFYCVLLGAGASADAGVPTSQQLVNEFLSSCADSVSSKITTVLDEKGRMEVANIEQLALFLRDRDPHLYAAIREYTITQLRTHGDCSYLRELYSLDLDGLFGITSLGEPVWSAIKNPEAVPHSTTTRIFSLNYDTCLEDSLGSNDPYLGLFVWDPDLKKYIYRPERLYDNASGTFIDPADNVDSGYTVAIPRNGIIKLHGSLNWLWKGQGRNRDLIVEQDVNLLNEAELIFGEPEKLRLTPPYNDLFYAFSLALSACAALIVIGYSWTDSHINRLIEHEGKRGMKVVNVSLSDETTLRCRPYLPPDAVFVKGYCKSVLERHPVEFAIGEEEWRTIEGGLVAVVRETLHQQLWIRTPNK